MKTSDVDLQMHMHLPLHFYKEMSVQPPTLAHKDTGTSHLLSPCSSEKSATTLAAHSTHVVRN